MDRVATIADGVVYDENKKTLSDGWSCQDGVFSAFWIASPQGRRWQVKARFFSTNALVMTNPDEEESFVLIREGRGIRTIFDSERPGYELARIIREDSLGRGLFGVYAREGNLQDGFEEWLIAAALATWSVDGPRQMRI
ncbi:hypothetical protein [Corynebacterium vitaeruminis]|uniref:hypothetical protein n=1 Tax=Corynebacterium vitaeruminis TaxID=38305 RepID=UPI000660E7A4|nr:hypothetical protein [Corynebacterium vitaeruminis]